MFTLYLAFFPWCHLQKSYDLDITDEQVIQIKSFHNVYTYSNMRARGQSHTYVWLIPEFSIVYL